MNSESMEHGTSGAGAEENNLDQRGPEAKTDEARGDGSEIGEDASTTQQFVTFFSGNEIFAAEMSPVREIIRLRWKASQICAARCYRSSHCAICSAFLSWRIVIPPGHW
jgi:hypothetical protein